jgi:phosphoribosylaminoimidazole-succinocarboxamide synthase
MDTVTATNIPGYQLLHRGKVRDIYEVDAETLLIVTTDRISAFDVVMPDPIPYKGAILNQITLFWMEKFQGLVDNHVLASRVEDFPEPLQAHGDELRGRSVLVKRCKPLPIECIVRGHITGSGWKDYQRTGAVCGHDLPPGLQESEKLDPPLFTPSTKAELGAHDENISVDEACALVGDELCRTVEQLSLDIFQAGREYAADNGLIIADTKFEFGLVGEQLMLIDEVLTPDSSRFWPAADYQPGRSQPSFDKQYLRDYLSSIGFDKQPPGPALPPEVIEQTQKKYMEAFTRLTGRESLEGA